MFLKQQILKLLKYQLAMATLFRFIFAVKESRKLCTTIRRDMNDIKKVNIKYKLLMNMCDFISNAQYKLVTF